VGGGGCTAQPATPPAKTLLTKKDVDLSFSLYLMSGAARLLSARTCCVPQACKSADGADGGVVVIKNAADSITGRRAATRSLGNREEGGVARNFSPRFERRFAGPREGQKKLGGGEWGRKRASGPEIPDLTTFPKEEGGRQVTRFRGQLLISRPRVKGGPTNCLRL
jgi:hypothetical protein